MKDEILPEWLLEKNLGGFKKGETCVIMAKPSPCTKSFIVENFLRKLEKANIAKC